MNTHKRNDVADLIRQRQTAGCSGIGRPTAVARTGPSYLTVSYTHLDWSHLAIGDPLGGVIDITSFPDGVRKGRWNIGGYQPEARWWSPDGRHLAVAGSKGCLLYTSRCV